MSEQQEPRGVSVFTMPGENNSAVFLLSCNDNSVILLTAFHDGENIIGVKPGMEGKVSIPTGVDARLLREALDKANAATRELLEAVNKHVLSHP